MTKSESQMTHTTKSEYKRIGKPKGYKSNGKGETGYDSSEDSQPTEPSTVTRDKRDVASVGLAFRGLHPDLENVSGFAWSLPSRLVQHKKMSSLFVFMAASRRLAPRRQPTHQLDLSIVKRRTL
jgi:hypothetical protein